MRGSRPLKMWPPRLPKHRRSVRTRRKEKIFLNCVIIYTLISLNRVVLMQLESRYICVPINILDIFFCMLSIKLLRNSVVVWLLFEDLLGGTTGVYGLRLIIAHCWGFGVLTPVPVILGCFSLAVGSSWHPQPWCKLGHHVLYSIRPSLLSLDSSTQARANHGSAGHPGRALGRYPEIFSVSHSLLWSFLQQTLWIFLDAQLCDLLYLFVSVFL